MGSYTRRDHFTAALLMLSTIEIIGLLSHRLMLNDDQLYAATGAAVGLVGLVFYNIAYQYRISLTVAIILAIVNLILFLNLVHYISAWNGCKNWDGLLYPNIVCGFIFMLKYYFPWMMTKVDYVIWLISELVLVTLLLAYSIAGRRLGLK